MFRFHSILSLISKVFCLGLSLLLMACAGGAPSSAPGLTTVGTGSSVESGQVQVGASLDQSTSASTNAAAPMQLSGTVSPGDDHTERVEAINYVVTFPKTPENFSVGEEGIRLQGIVTKSHKKSPSLQGKVLNIVDHRGSDQLFTPLKVKDETGNEASFDVVIDVDPFSYEDLFTHIKDIEFYVSPEGLQVPQVLLGETIECVALLCPAKGWHYTFKDEGPNSTQPAGTSATGDSTEPASSGSQPPPIRLPGKTK